MAAMEAKRPSATATPAQTTSLEDRLGALLGDAPELPPMESATAPTAEAEVAPAVATTEADAPPAAAPAAQSVSTSPAPTVYATLVATVSAPPASTPAPMLQSRPMTNLSAGEKREASLQAELYSILVTMEHLEGAFVKGLVDNDSYESHCKQIVTQFKTLQKALASQVPDVGAWIDSQGLETPLAKERLLGTGVAATRVYGGATGDRNSGKEALAIHSATEHFITFTNALQVGYTSCLELLPLIQELQASIVSIHGLPQLQGLDRITNWLVTLNNMRAADTLNESQVKQLTLDVELAYTSFRNWLQSQ